MLHITDADFDPVTHWGEPTHYVAPCDDITSDPAWFMSARVRCHACIQVFEAATDGG